MESELLERMRRAYGSVRTGELDEVMELIDPAIEIRDRPESPDPQTYHGAEGVRTALEQSAETFEVFELEPEKFVETGDRIVVVLQMRGRGKESGVPVEDRIAHLWTMREGRARAMQVYSDPEQALAEAKAAVNVDVVERAWAAWFEGDLERAVADFDPGAEWTPPPEGPEAETEHGPEGALRSLGRWVGGWDEYDVRIEEIVPAGEHVLVRARQRGRGPESGIEMESPLYHVWTIRDGKVVAVRAYLDEPSALAAAGL